MRGVGKRKLEGLVVSGELGRSICFWGSTDPACVSYDPAMAGQPAIPYSANLRSITPFANQCLAQLAMGCSNPSFVPASTQVAATA